MVVMDYANKGNLRGNLTRIVKSDWYQKLYMLFGIISGLNCIHKQDLIHCDFHDGNILNHNESKIYISDLGLCKPLKSFLKKYDIYGVIPFMAPEVLRGNPYTTASDIYSFSIIMWEFTSGVPPFNNRAHDFQLSLSICEGERPEIIENTPQCYVDLMKKCWDENPLKRPSSKVLLKSGYNLTTESHPQAYYKSRFLDFTSKQLNEILESRDLQAYYSSQTTSGKVNEILESEDSQTSVKVNEMSKNLDDCIFNLKSLGM
ncbi:kinase-like domain-containing protein [Rhizophagus irregularis DAOM 181602=DAOM 197198]|uniref:Kic1p n=1 Tax=Rhizophagus irregularis (strain DAOM 197198w) TaxID=1432141 RepID=A0A015J320_RHIIW|nr:Kic1p [Rhizophagus irregularis DAOM 197198w]GET64786.1 kinase-like domain-containing protein [Rhizophagus irregularis DAOM 181602=DAOM 197198]